MRTNIVIDESLIEKAMTLSGIKTKREMVERALEEYVQRRSRKDLSELRGLVSFAEGYDYKTLRESRNDIGSR